MKGGVYRMLTAFSAFAGMMWNMLATRKPLSVIAKPTNTSFYPTENFSNN